MMQSDPLVPPAVPAAHTVRLALPVHKPYLTYLLLALNGLVWLAMTLMGGSTNTYILVLFGAKYNPLIVAGQYWRLLTACFLHIGIVHLAFNSYALWALGLDVERRFGRGRFLSLYLLSGVGGFVLSFLGSDKISAGASAAIFGLIGAITVYFATYREQFGSWGRRRLSSLFGVIAMNLIFGFINPGIDNLGHIGGLLVGAALGWAYCPRYKLERVAPDRVQLIDRLPKIRAYLVSFGTLFVLVVLTWLGARA